MAMLRNLTTGADLSADVRRAGNPLARAVGWLGAAAIAPSAGTWLEPCSAIHTIGMRSAIDVLFLDADNRVIALRPRVQPHRPWISHRRTRLVVEMGPGFLATAEVAVGDRLALVDIPPTRQKDGMP